MKRLAAISFLLFSCVLLRAQFSLSGSDPGSVRWMQTETSRFRIIYPAGSDSLARIYGSWLEKAADAVSWSSGMRIGEFTRGRMPVVLHGFTPISNASVTWAPKRMDMYTVPDPYAPTPVRWERLLAVHEGRHAAQMQAGAGGRNRFAGYLLGEMFAGAMAGLYPGPTLLEGDAVVAETALTRSGRGRQASFLAYLAPAFDNGDWRDYWRWSFGSDKLYTPDHYRAGYMLVSGMRVFFDDPSFTDRYFSGIRKKSLLLNLRKTVKSASGTGVTKTFRTIEERFRDMWDGESIQRGPFMPYRQVSPVLWRYTAYSGSVTDSDGRIWSVMGGPADETSLVRTAPDGSLEKIRPFASYTGKLAYDKAGDRIWWSESVSGRRWSLGGSSRIRYIRTGYPSKVHDLTASGKYFNPSPSPDGKTVCATEYPASGGSRLVLLDSEDGSIVSLMEAPDSLQITESVWVNGKLFAAGLSDNGMGIYDIPSFSCILGPEPVELSCLRSAPGGICFVCDRTGVNELYLLDLENVSLKQVTSTRYGISSPIFNESGDTLYYSSPAPYDKPEAGKVGMLIYATASEDLPMKDADFGNIHENFVAKTLAAQEKSLSRGEWKEMEEYHEATFSEPVRFRKLTPSIHSWAPIYFNYDNVSEISGDSYYQAASPGATVLFQNLVGDGYGFIGYGFHEDPGLEGSWRHSGHFKYQYSGLFPVLEFSADLGDRAAEELIRVQLKDVGKRKESVSTDRTRMDRPYFEGSLRAYVPLNFSSGGMSRGLVPQARFKFTNDILNDGISLREVDGNDEESVPKETGHLGENGKSALSVLDLSVRGYVLKDKAPAQVYPRLGIGAEAGFRTRPGHLAAYSNTAYLYMYGYLPGILKDQGLKITAAAGADLGGGTYSYPDVPASFIPRGFVGTNARSMVNSCAPEKYRLTFDYAVPFLHPDWSGLCPIAYVKTITITPFFDYSYFKFKDFKDFHINKTGVASGFMSSVGADLTVTLGNLLWLPYESRLGVRYARNGYGEAEGRGLTKIKKDYFEMIFNVSL